MDDKIVEGFFELLHLTKTLRSGWSIVGVSDFESVAEHALTAAQIGYVLAVMEGVNPERVACMLMIHDNGEARISDINHLAGRYLNNKKDIERTSFRDQISRFPLSVQNKWLEYFDEYQARDTPEAIVAKDADNLQLAFQAKKCIDSGYSAAWRFFNTTGKLLLSSL